MPVLTPTGTYGDWRCASEFLVYSIVSVGLTQTHAWTLQLLIRGLRREAARAGFVNISYQLLYAAAAAAAANVARPTTGYYLLLLRLRKS